MAVVALLLAGCAGLGPETRPFSQPGFEFTARIGVRHADGGFTGRIRWRREGAADAMDLLTPLGQVVAELRQTPRGAVLWVPDREPRQYADIGHLAADILGRPIPVAELADWVQGRPVPGLPADNPEYDELRRPIRWTQAGWTVAVGWASPSPLPAQLELRRDDVTVKLVIDRWAHPPGAP